MTKVDCILVVDVASLSLLAQCCCCLWRCKSVTEPSPRRQLLGRLLSAFPNAQIEQLHHCMLFSLQHLQFVMQWSSSLHTEHSHTSRADQDKHTQISRHRKTSPPKIHDTFISPVKWNHVHHEECFAKRSYQQFRTKSLSNFDGTQLSLDECVYSK
jgi:hypothetical protein